MEARHLVLAVLVLVDLPLFYLLFRVLFPTRGEKGLGVAQDLLDTRSRNESGGNSKLVLLLVAAALLVFIEYTVVLSLVPSLRAAPFPRALP